MKAVTPGPLPQLLSSVSLQGKAAVKPPQTKASLMKGVPGTPAPAKASTAQADTPAPQKARPAIPAKVNEARSPRMSQGVSRRLGL